ncbi:PDR/VanB family oxidoreductase [Streptomyces mexicanus]|uniref:PDR/VanB family oxidoreductase n=1 Tax=Streptomyces mexicanus TaxID=178566 RepID=UPI003015BE44
MTTVIPARTAGDPEAGLDLVLTAKEAVARDVVRLTLARPDGGALPAWQPGAHIDLVLPDGTTRQYSLCGDRQETDTYRVAVLREPAGRGGSAYVHDRLAPGDPVRVRGPRDNFVFAPSPRYLFLAGGIGVTPLIPMLAEAERQGAEWELVYGGRSLDAMAFHAELRAAHGERVRLVPQDTHGLPDLDALLGSPRPDTLVYSCGPEGMLRAVEERCAAWPPGALRTERFAPKEVQDAGEEREFEVELARSGRTVTVPPGTSVLDAVEQAGVQVLSSCREGTCGTCETTVLAGTVQHRDSLLTPAEQAAHDTMMICVSRAACPRLVLDL